MKKQFLESNMEIFRNNQEIILTITGKKLKNSTHDLIAFENSGKQFLNLTTQEQLAAEKILLREGT